MVALCSSILTQCDARTQVTIHKPNVWDMCFVVKVKTNKQTKPVHCRSRPVLPEAETLKTERRPEVGPRAVTHLEKRETFPITECDGLGNTVHL